MEQKAIVKRKIKELVYLHGVHVKNLTGLEINCEAEEKRIYADWQAGLVTLDEIKKDFEEYLEMRKDDNQFGR